MKNKEKNIKSNLWFFNTWARTYDNIIVQSWMKRFHVPLLKELKLSKKTKFLDISCGTGQLLRKLKGKAQLEGTDISGEMLKQARKHLPKEVKLTRADVHKLPHKDNTFDYVTTTEAFHHYYDQEKALKEMARVAKKGGKVIVVDINFFLRPLHFIFQKLEPGCVKVNSKKEMKKMFMKAGLKNIRQRRNFTFSVMTVGEK